MVCRRQVGDGILSTSRDYEISVEELQKISQWKLQSTRNDSNIAKNTTTAVEQQSHAALQASSDTEAIAALTQLSGVGVPMASTVLTVAEPTQYAIIDYRAFRGLAGVHPQLLDSQHYAASAEFLEHFRTYLTKPEAYAYYMKHVREIAETEDLSAREVDMALWAFDKEKA